MSAHYPEIRARSTHGVLLIREALRFTFYMRHPHGEITHSVQRALELYQRAIEPDTLGQYANEEGDWWPIDDEGRSFIREQFLHPELASIHLAGTPGHERRFYFDYLGKPLGAPTLASNPSAVSAVSFWLPTEYLEKHGPGRVRELALELASLLPFCSGHGGLAFNCDPGLAGIPRELLKWCFRHPGLDIPDLSGDALHVGTRVRTIAWLTFLGQPVLGELGGPEPLRARLQTPGSTVQQWDGDRAVVTLGPRPEAGDTEHGQSLPAYQELARVLEPWTYFSSSTSHAYFHSEDQRRWERRFLDGLAA